MEGELKRGRQRGRQSHKINKKERRTRQTHANKNNIAKKKKREREREKRIIIVTNRVGVVSFYIERKT